MDESKKNSSNVDLLEKELYFKQLQISRLLELTQSINNNAKAQELFSTYNDIIGWVLKIKKMLLFVKHEDGWEIATSLGLHEVEMTKLDFTDDIKTYTRTGMIDSEHPLLSQFDVIVPVNHKQEPIAFALIGDVDANEEVYEKIKFITTITNIIIVALENKRLFKRQLEQEGLKREMELGRDVQSMLIPESLPSTPRYELASIYQPHMSVGGDYFDFVKFKGNDFLFCIADISGKGVSAALLMANFQANIQTLSRQKITPGKFIRLLNKKVLNITKGERFITFFIAHYFADKKKLVYVNCGHNPPVLVRNGKTILLDKGCTILGMFDDLPEIEVGMERIHDDTLIVAYTDGLTDLRNKHGDFFETDLLAEFSLENSHLSANSFNERLQKHIKEFKGDSPYPDDIAVVTCKIFPNDG